MKLNISSFLEVSTLDYPGQISSVLWLSGCPFRCPFCQNSSVAASIDSTEIGVEELYEKIKRNKEFVDAVTITGGEPTLQHKPLNELLIRLKKIGFLTHINTNGFFPKSLNELLPNLDYVSIDIKNVLDPEIYQKTIGISEGEKAVTNLIRSLEFLKENRGKYGYKVEIRTTIVPGLNDSINAVDEISKNASWADLFVLNTYRNDTVFDPEYKKIMPPGKELMNDLLKTAKKNMKNTIIR